MYTYVAFGVCASVCVCIVYGVGVAFASCSCVCIIILLILESLAYIGKQVNHSDSIDTALLYHLQISGSTRIA